jgi:hypothetical protein
MTTALKAGDLLHAKLQSILVLIFPPSVVVASAARELILKQGEKEGDSHEKQIEPSGHSFTQPF